MVKIYKMTAILIILTIYLLTEYLFYWIIKKDIGKLNIFYYVKIRLLWCSKELRRSFVEFINYFE